MNRSLLIVEDDPDQLEMLARWFVRADYRVVGASHPRQALEAAGVQQFQVALIDVGLPEMDGLELVQRLKRNQHSIQLVMLSGQVDSQWRANEEGVFAWLAKPCKLSLLETAVAEALEGILKDRAFGGETCHSREQRS